MTNIIKSIQQITVTVSAGSASNTGTITSVTTANTEIWYDSFTSAETTNNFDLYFARAVLTNATTVTVTRGVSASTASLTVYLTIVEYQGMALNSAIQQGTITLASVASNTATITSVTTGRAVCSYSGWSCSAADNFPGREFTAATLTNATTVTGIRGTNPANTIIIAYCVVEYVSSVLNSNTQQFTTTLNTTGTSITQAVTSVTTTNSIIRMGGFTIASTSTVNATDILYTVELTNATTITLTRIGTNNTDVRKYYYTLVEFVSGVLTTNAVQRGTVALTSQTSNTATITSISTTFGAINWCMFRMGLSSVPVGTNFSSLNLSSNTAVQAKMNTSNATANTSSYEAIEFVSSSVAPTTLAGTGGSISEFAISETPISGSGSTPRIFMPWEEMNGGVWEQTGGMRG